MRHAEAHYTELRHGEERKPVDEPDRCEKLKQENERLNQLIKEKGHYHHS